MVMEDKRSREVEGGERMGLLVAQMRLNKAIIIDYLSPSTLAKAMQDVPSTPFEVLSQDPNGS